MNETNDSMWYKGAVIILSPIKETLQKEKHKLVTVVEFAKFEGITVDEVQPYLI